MTTTIVRVQLYTQSKIMEYIMSERDEVYELALMLEANTRVKAYQLYCGGERVQSYHSEYGVSESIRVNKFTPDDFSW
jgi:hypothetical protein